MVWYKSSRSTIVILSGMTLIWVTLSKIKIWRSSKYLSYLSQGKIGEAKPEVKSLVPAGVDQEVGYKARTRQMGPPGATTRAGVAKPALLRCWPWGKWEKEV